MCLEHVKADGVLRVGRVNQDEFVAEILIQSLFLAGNKREGVRREVAMQIKQKETASGCNVLTGQFADEGRFALASLPEQADMFRSFVVR